MSFWPFDSQEILTVSKALEIAEEKIGDYYQFSSGQWRRHRFDVKTLTDLRDYEITPNAFALLNKCSRAIDGYESKTRSRDFYFICLQDHRILWALKRDRQIELLPLLVYILTHELVHIVRFCNFSQRFEILGTDRDKEERIVHATTYEILRDLCLKNMDYLLDSYLGHRTFDPVMS